MRLVLSDGSLAQGAESDPALVKVLERAGHWGNLLVCGKVKSVCDLAQQEGVGVSYVKRLLPLAFLAPDIRDAIMEGKQPAELSAQRLTHLPSLPLAWDEQRKILGFTN
ncbi:MAG: hypothetical protein A2018_04990 [Alphaproteobacteria bacterium GWF2_58_20]|nr:MAG: hypothetical protein A2018_04990 [Alphaproteobacteria bacterium GWF2_58_20]